MASHGVRALADLPFDVLALKLAEAKAHNAALSSTLHELHTELRQVRCASARRRALSSAGRAAGVRTRVAPRHQALRARARLGAARPAALGRAARPVCPAMLRASAHPPTLTAPRLSASPAPAHASAASLRHRR